MAGTRRRIRASAKEMQPHIGRATPDRRYSVMGIMRIVWFDPRFFQWMEGGLSKNPR